MRGRRACASKSCCSCAQAQTGQQPVAAEETAAAAEAGSSSSSSSHLQGGRAVEASAVEYEVGRGEGRAGLPGHRKPRARGRKGRGRTAHRQRAPRRALPFALEQGCAGQQGGPGPADKVAAAVPRRVPAGSSAGGLEKGRPAEAHAGQAQEHVVEARGERGAGKAGRKSRALALALPALEVADALLQHLLEGLVVVLVVLVLLLVSACPRPRAPPAGGQGHGREVKA
jgi:hypothetical protein